jgi:glutamate dehydrogenase (NADP+)
MLKTRGEDFKGKTCLVSGSGNVAQYTIEKLNEFGAKCVTASDSDGTIYDKDGIDPEKLAWIMELKNGRRGRIKEYVTKFPKAEFLPHKKPWHIPAQCAFPSATQNEISGEDAALMIKNGCYLVGEGANMPTMPDGVERFRAAKVLFGPGKAANAGGVATSGLEMAQNSMRISWGREEVEARLKGIMTAIHSMAWETSKDFGCPGDYVTGANIAGFAKVADAMLAQGLV